MKIGTKLRIAFLALIILSAANALINIVRLDSAEEMLQNVISKDYPAVHTTDLLISEINYFARPLRNVIIFPGKAEEIRQDSLRRKSENKLTKYISELQLHADTPERQNQLNELRSIYKVFLEQADQVFNFIAIGERDKAIDFMQNTMRKNTIEITAQSEKIAAYYDKIIKEEMQKAEDNMHEMYMWAIILFICILLASIVLSWVAARMVTKPLTTALDAANSIAKGDFNINLSSDSKDEFGTLLGALDNMRNNIQNVLNDAKELGQDAVAGRLDRRADTSKLSGEYRELVASINYTLDAVINPLNITAEYIDRLSKGDIPPRIVDEYKGDFNEIKNNLNAMISTFEAYVNENQRMYKAQVTGDIDEVMDSAKFIGVFRTMSEGTNEAMKLHIDNILLILDILKDYAEGDITRDMKRLPGKQIIANQVMDKLKANLLEVISAIKKTSMEQAAGDLEAHIDTTQFKGAFLEMTAGFNACVAQIHGSVEKILTMATRYGNGDLSEALEQLPGKQVVGNIALDSLRNNLLAVMKELDTLVQKAKDGNLKYRGDAKNHKGAYGQIVTGLNELLDTLIEPFTLTNDYVGRIADGDIPAPIEKKFNGDFATIVGSLNRCIYTMNGLLKESDMLINGLKNGNLSVNANAQNFEGAWSNLIEGMNGIIDTIKTPIEETSKILQAIAVNDYTNKVDGQFKGEWAILKQHVNDVIDRLQNVQKIAQYVSVGDLSLLESFMAMPSRSENDKLRPAFINMMQAIKSLVEDTTTLAENIQNGNLSYRSDAGKHPGQYGEVITEVNKSINTMHDDIKVALNFLNRVSNGEDLEVLDESKFKGDNIQVARGINKLRNFLYEMIADTTNAAQAAIDGDLKTRIDVSKYPGGWNVIVSGFDNAIGALTNQFNIAMEFLDKVADGADLQVLDSSEYRGEFKTMVGNINRLRNFLYDMIADTAGAAKAVANGNLREASINVANYPGGWGEITGGFNDALKAMVEQFDMTGEFLAKVSKGDDIEVIDTALYNGQFKTMVEHINKLRNFLYDMIGDTQNSAKAAVNGDLSVRLDMKKYPGGWGVITGGFNDTLEAMVNPIEEAISTLEVMATGDLAAKMRGDYHGDHEKLKNSINKLGEELSSLIVQVLDGVESAASSAIQISASADTMSAQSHEQSAQSEQVASAVEEMSRTIAENAGNAVTTTNVAKQNGSIAREGGEVVEQTVKKMMDIAAVVKQSAENIEKLGQSSKQIGEIISVIDDIADQTNLLALNAAIEAARAGEQGRGFAVVADEVRKLAERTTEATKTISSMIISIQDETNTAVAVMQNGNNEVEQGILLADRAGKALNEIMHSSDKVIDMINQIASANEQQAATSEQLTQNITLISSATSESAQKIQEVAQASEDLSKLTEELRNLMDNFTIDSQMALRDGKILNAMTNHKKLLPDNNR